MDQAVEDGIELANGARPLAARAPRFTIATLVNNWAHYEEMLTSFEEGGFDRAECEYLFVDNTGAHQICAYRGLDRLLAEARGDYVIMCHQDVRLIGDGRYELEKKLAELDARDTNWALAGNAGGVAVGRLALRISDPHGEDRRVGAMPARVMSLDENFIVAKRAARLGFSKDLSGFHFYGADICLIADVLGHTAYVIDFHLEHLSAGLKGSSFAAMEEAFRNKWCRALRPRWMQTTCALIALSGDTLRQMLGRATEVPFAKIARRLPSARGWTRRSA